MLSEPSRTGYDLHFSTLGIPVRVTPFFFLLSAALGYEVSVAIGRFLALGQGMALFVWIGVCFVSILVHELGHSMAMRQNRIGSRIVLYHFGGLAIPTAGYGMRMRPQDQMFISFAGPGIQLLLAAIVIASLLAAGFAVPVPELLLRVFPESLFDSGRRLPNGVWVTVLFLLQVNIYWALLNLAPILPLDGGRIAQEMYLLFGARDATRNALMTSVVAAGCIAVWAISREDTFLAMMFFMLGFQNFQTLQHYNRFGGGW